ncbi:hypothetical protein LTR78_004315 [Recurvomyces mirabilis]|uniref:Dynactin subunit n=1 Tax=Recurvomyces mirabilis TaxID=574656 RepID=A0AAE0WPW5_9PEZI|nr:hypothetical protein LTR78_004315 [Recurvomyces mirabilis]KAK5156018.1 hypothetical protein LTS14_005584 [Recurvomyces mirabilis]
MTDATRLAALPGYDSAPDVYETADLADDTSTVQTSPRSPAETDATSEDEDEESDGYGVSRRRLYPERARLQFSAGSRRVETRGVDLSDRVDGKRKGFKVRPRTNEVEDGDDESLDIRIARLRREIEECKLEAEREKAAEESHADEEDGEDSAAPELDDLGRLLQSIQLPVKRYRRKAANIATTNGHSIPPDEEDLSDEQTLSRITDFDTRLHALEQALGISTIDAATNPDAISTPILPALNLLDQQLSALASATSLARLEAAGNRLHKLRSEAEYLSQSQLSSTEDGEETQTATLSLEDLAKLQQLYLLLPNLQSLSPTIPAILTRLRSLRTLHTTAAEAASKLERVEQRQAEMDSELAEWRTGLGKVEAAVQEASEANGRNGQVVQGWVKDLEGRVRGL